MKFVEQLKRIRRFLRDPDGNIWSRSLLTNLYNDAQKEIQHRTRYLEDIKVMGLPAYYQMSYMYDWEWPYMTGSKFHKIFSEFHDGTVYIHQWEAQEYAGQSASLSDWGAHFTQPWEAWMGLTVGEEIKVKFPENFHAVKYMAYDKEPLEYAERKSIQKDRSYVSREGDSFCYYLDDELGNEFIPYPRPSSVTWTDLVDGADPDYIYTFDFETDYMSGDGEQFVFEDSTNSRNHVFVWEDDLGSDQDAYRGMYLFEGEFSLGAMILDSGSSVDDLGTWADQSDALLSQDEGIAISVIDDDNNILLFYDINPTDLNEDQDESDFPSFLQKYNEYMVTSRAYGANTDGRIKSLSDYWSYRHDVGIEMIKRFMIKRRQDRDYQLTHFPTTRTSRRHPRLPDGYPAIG